MSDINIGYEDIVNIQVMIAIASITRTLAVFRIFAHKSLLVNQETM